jgi:hypothetical protein
MPYTLEEYNDWQSRFRGGPERQLTADQCESLSELLVGTTEDFDIVLIELNIGPFDTQEERLARADLKRYQRLRQCPDCALWYRGKRNCPDCG